MIKKRKNRSRIRRLINNLNQNQCLSCSVHHDYPESLHPHHHGHHGTESFGHFGHNSPYGSFGGSADPSEDGYSSASASNGETMEGAASNHAHGTLGPHGTGEYDPYHKK